MPLWPLDCYVDMQRKGADHARRWGIRGFGCVLLAVVNGSDTAGDRTVVHNCGKWKRQMDTLLRAVFHAVLSAAR
jgi:hypothetical protein